MAIEACPSHVRLMEGLTYPLDGMQAYFNPRSSEYTSWLKYANELNLEIKKGDIFTVDEDFVTLIQLLFLTPLIGLGNISNEFFKDCQFNQSEIFIEWQGQSDWHLHYGKWDKAMTTFLFGFMHLVFKESQPIISLTPLLFNRLKICYQNLQSNLNESHAIALQAKAAAQVPEYEKQPSYAVIFSILSAFPMDELNAFYLKLAAKLGPDMVINDSVKMPLNINKFYQTPSQDITFLLEKTRLHFNLLYYGKGLKAEQKKLLESFWPYLVRRLENYDVKEYVLDQLQQAIALQFESRAQYYQLMLKLLSAF